MASPVLLAILSTFTHNFTKLHSGGFAMLVRSRNVQLGLMLSAVLTVLMWPAAGHAYTQEEQQACSGDAFRLCGSEIPDVDRVTVCMVRNRAQLSPGCRAYVKPDPELTPVAARKPMSIKPEASKKRKPRRDDD